MLSSRHSQKLKNMKRIRRCKGEPGEALLEGPHLIGAALSAGLEVDSVLATAEFWESPAAASLHHTLPSPPQLATRAVLEELADADSPRGIVARTRLRLLRIDRLPRQDSAPYVYLDGIQDPGNLGAIARVAEAAGAAALVLGPGCVHAVHPRSLRASAGSLLRLPVAPDARLDELRGHLAPVGARLAVLVPRGGTELYAADAALTGALILALGAEGGGVGEPILDVADICLTIPMEPAVESLNVAVAAAVVLYERRRQVRLA